VSSSGPLFCVDASVGAKWFLTDEADGGHARLLLNLFVTGDLDFVVPELFFYELGNILIKAARSGRLPEKDQLACLEQVNGLHLKTVGARGTVSAALFYSRLLGVSFYDATYLAVAESLSIPLVTCDSRLLRAASARVDWVMTPAAAAESVSAR